MGKKKYPNQVININGPAPDSDPQEININGPGPRYAGGTSQLVILFAVGLFLVIIACGVASALTAGAIW